MEFFFDFESGESRTLQERIFNAVRDAVISGRLRVGERAPSSRELAAALGVSRNTVSEAYARLETEGYLESRGRTGSFVPKALPDICIVQRSDQKSSDASPPHSSLRPAITFKGKRPAIVENGSERPRIDFWYGQGDRQCFPVAAWRRILNENFGRAAANLTKYPAIVGLPQLRRAIAEHLSVSRGISVDSERVIITAGAQEAFSLIARLFITPDTEVVVENPCYQGFAFACSAQGARLRPVSVDAYGIDVGELDSVRHAPLAYVTPSHQFPTGATIPLERRLRLLAWAARIGAYIVEDDYDSDFRYDGPPVLALAGLDRTGDRVIYVGTFSKSLGAGLRIGFLVAPREIIDALTTAKALASSGQHWLDQTCLAEFINSGGYRRHLRKLRESRRQSKNALIDALRRHFGAVDLSGTEGGMHLMWRLPADMKAVAFVSEARTLGVGIYTPSDAGAAVFGAEPNAIVLGYSSLTEEEIENGVALLAQAARRSTSPLAP